MKSKPKKAAGTRPIRAIRPRRPARWQIADLPQELQAELRNRIDEATRGENLVPFDDALREADRMATEIGEILDRPIVRRSAG